MRTVDLHRFEPSDYAAARSLWERTPGVGLSDADELPAIQAFLIRNPGLSLVAKCDGALVGTVLCGHDGRRGLIHHLVTDASYRRQGIGRRLLFAGLRSLRAAGIQKCHVLVFRSNIEGLQFWCAVSAKERVEMALFSLSTQYGG